ncbi:MAG: hypothetical protein H7174_07280 [Flavobacterium sp.]|nr:hypothetical protein [Flavobacterium sp.]
MKKKFILLLLISLGFSGCEKDDICAADTPTTPQVVIEFLDIATTDSKSVTNLTIKEVGQTNPIVFNTSLASTNVLRYNVSLAKIKIPLKTDADTAKFLFKLNTGNTVLGAENTDILEFNYTRNSVYISRACGYKTLFALNLNSLTPTNISASDTFWIQSIVIVKPNILNENETHIKIYF